MKRLLAIATAAVLALGGTALAADPVASPILPAPPPPSDPGFRWGGLYVGAFGGAVIYPGSCVDEDGVDHSPCYNSISTLFAGAQVGLNIQGDRVLVGIEGQIGRAFTDPGVWAVGVNARAGLLVGQGALVYLEAGAALPVPGGVFPDDLTVNIGGGFEFAVGERTSLFVEAKAIFDPAGFDYVGTLVTAGLNFDLPGRRR